MEFEKRGKATLGSAPTSWKPSSTPTHLGQPEWEASHVGGVRAVHAVAKEQLVAGTFSSDHSTLRASTSAADRG